MSEIVEMMSNVHDLRKDVRNLKRTFSFGRPASSKLETYWVDEYLCKLPCMVENGAYKDKFQYRGELQGNIIVKVGENPNILWSSHTDTVHRSGVIQNVFCNPDTLKFSTDSGQCLGGDDGSGVWLMLEFLKAGMEGLYVFHRAEEVGGQGSSHLANNSLDLIKDMDFAIAFDRKDAFSIITHQGCARTASDKWAIEMGKELKLGHKTDPTGTFTDTKNYYRIIPECTNFSIGYHNAHSAREIQEILYIIKLRDAFFNVKDTYLKTMKPYREIGDDEYSNVGMSGFGGGNSRPPRAISGFAGWTTQDERILQARKERAKSGVSVTTFGKDDEDAFPNDICPYCGGEVVNAGMDEVCSECGQIILDIDEDYDQISDRDFEQQYGDIVEDRKGISGILVEDDDEIGFFDETSLWGKMLKTIGDTYKQFTTVDDMISPKDKPKKGSSNIPKPDDIEGVLDETEEYNFKDFFDNY
tara:strand:- start:2659 stop:4071 length:1413 start_codon:yes stop_codon:yes gene_type:complete